MQLCIRMVTEARQPTDVALYKDYLHALNECYELRCEAESDVKQNLM